MTVLREFDENILNRPKVTEKRLLLVEASAVPSLP